MDTDNRKLAAQTLSFWFEEISAELWFKKDDAFDSLLAERFGRLVEQALAGQLDSWAGAAEGRLALILLLDQMTRNIYRGRPAAFAGDDMALALSVRAEKEGMIAAEPQVERRQFFLMPMMHSEDIQIQKTSLPLFRAHTTERTYDYAVRHHDIIARFGRFPHRNAVLGRPSSQEELDFLTGPNSSF